MEHGADTKVASNHAYPIHAAAKYNSNDCVTTILMFDKQCPHAKDTKYGGTSLHWAKTRQVCGISSCTQTLVFVLASVAHQTLDNWGVATYLNIMHVPHNCAAQLRKTKKTKNKYIKIAKNLAYLFGLANQP